MLHPYVANHNGHSAFLLDYKPEFGAKAKSEGVFQLDGLPMPYGADIICGTYGESFRPKTTEIEENQRGEENGTR